ncbi:MAG: Stp1/IreP family PP2C-type Ser/Thr phosphatase [Acidimicrobiales bacterium]|nr:Stp1/IreP family PP2C-type Ser/Thr phosphatase [Acidimicrobiales bacterium]
MTTPALRSGAACHVGRVRAVNQDGALTAERLFAVADGMGGHAAGEVASQTALQVLAAGFDEPTAGRFLDGVEAANRAVYEKALADPELAGMGTTLVAVALVDGAGGAGPHLVLANIGDSRAYLLERDGSLGRLTVDHSLVEEMVHDGRLTADEARVHPHRNILTRALGIDPDVPIDVWELTAHTGDRYLLCSDGLFNELDDDRIAATLRRLAEPTEAADELVRLANAAGGRDNITAVVVDVVHADEADDRPRTLSAAVIGGSPATRVQRRAEHEAEGDDHTTAADVVTLDADADATDTDATDTAGAEAARPEAAPADGRAAGDEPAAHQQRRAAARPAAPRRVTWRSVAFTVLFLGVLGLGAGAVWWYARGTYYVAFRDDEVVIFRGRSDNVLWFNSTVEEVTDLSRSDVPPRFLADLDAGKQQSTLEDARRYVARISLEADRLEDARSALTPTTATTAPSTTARPTTTTPTTTAGAPAPPGTAAP